MARKLERCEVMKMWVFSILNDKDVETWLRDNGYDIKNPNIAPIDVAVKSGSLIEIDEKHFATTKAKDEKTDTTWILDEIWKLTDKEMKANDLHCRYRYKAHVAECPSEYTGVKEINAGFNFYEKSTITRKLKEKNRIMMRAVNIKWDTDGYDELLCLLPTEMEIPKGMTDEDEISDWLSNEVGFCHNGFELTNDANFK